MAEQTAIAWATSSWSPWIGCTKVSPGCDGCYAEALDRRHRWHGAEHWGPGIPRMRIAESTWNKPLVWDKKAATTGERWTVFPSLCDPFDNEISETWRADFMRMIIATENLTWLLLTKRIGNAAGMLARYFPDGSMPSNLWVGASVVNQEEADRDIPKLLRVPCSVRFVSYEPALGPVDFMPFLAPVVGSVRWSPGRGPTPAGIREVYTVARSVVMEMEPGRAFIDWLIVGGESSQGSHKARPFDLEWARNTVRSCLSTGVPVFVKQLGSRPQSNPDEAREYGLIMRDRAGANPAEWPLDLQVQEFPK